MPFAYYIITAMTAAASSFLGTSVGGAGLILIPMLILMGLSPTAAVATGILAILVLALLAGGSFTKGNK